MSSFWHSFYFLHETRSENKSRGKNSEFSLFCVTNIQDFMSAVCTWHEDFVFCAYDLFHLETECSWPWSLVSWAFLSSRSIVWAPFSYGIHTHRQRKLKPLKVSHREPELGLKLQKTAVLNSSWLSSLGLMQGRSEQQAFSLQLISH